MRKCGGCYFFKHQAPISEGESASCSELGSLAEDVACGDFRVGRHATEKTPEIVLNEARDELVDGKIQFNVSQKENLFNIFTDIFTIEQDTNIVVEKIKAEIEKQGYHLPFNANKIYNFQSKLTELYLLYRMTLASGMGTYLEDIMKLTIEKLFSDPRKYHPKPRERGFIEKEK